MSAHEIGIAYIITNKEGTKHKKIFEQLCNKSIAFTKKNTASKHTQPLPVAVISLASQKQVNADIHIDAEPFVKNYIDRSDHGMILAELLKTHICEWSPFEKTIYLDCDAVILSKSVTDFVDILNKGYEISICTCATMGWKDHIGLSLINTRLYEGIPKYMTYWNFGVFGINKNSATIMGEIREEYMKYCFGMKKSRFVYGSDTPANLQPALSQVAWKRSPDTKIFTMPSRYNVHFSASTGYAFSERAVVLHLWKDVRELML